MLLLKLSSLYLRSFKPHFGNKNKPNLLFFSVVFKNINPPAPQLSSLLLIKSQEKERAEIQLETLVCIVKHDESISQPCSKNMCHVPYYVTSKEVWVVTCFIISLLETCLIVALIRILKA